ncbi:katanin p80 WD40 repeat-containing subunit B1 [Trichonephila clavipes]|nr:katanin p80 WD40 repeat-containing subunit B1 [Trichonephila clavipes]
MLWDLPAGKLRTEFKGHSSGVSDIEFHPNELLLGSCSSDQYVKFWDLENHRLVSNTDGDSGPVQEIGSRVGQNLTNVMRIYVHWMQEGKTNRRGLSHPPQCTTSREDRQIVRISVTDRSVSSRTVPQHIESVTHHSVSARTLRRHLQQSGRPQDVHCLVYP